MLLNSAKVLAPRVLVITAAFALLTLFARLFYQLATIENDGSAPDARDVITYGWAGYLMIRYSASAFLIHRNKVFIDNAVDYMLVFSPDLTEVSESTTINQIENAPGEHANLKQDLLHASRSLSIILTPAEDKQNSVISASPHSSSKQLPFLLPSSADIKTTNYHSSNINIDDTNNNYYNEVTLEVKDADGQNGTFNAVVPELPNAVKHQRLSIEDDESSLVMQLPVYQATGSSAVNLCDQTQPQPRNSMVGISGYKTGKRLSMSTNPDVSPPQVPNPFAETSTEDVDVQARQSDSEQRNNDAGLYAEGGANDSGRDMISAESQQHQQQPDKENQYENGYGNRGRRSTWDNTSSAGNTVSHTSTTRKNSHGEIKRVLSLKNKMSVTVSSVGTGGVERKTSSIFSGSDRGGNDSVIVVDMAALEKADVAISPEKTIAEGMMSRAATVRSRRRSMIRVRSTAAIVEGEVYAPEENSTLRSEIPSTVDIPHERGMSLTSSYTYRDTQTVQIDENMNSSRSQSILGEGSNNDVTFASIKNVNVEGGNLNAISGGDSKAIATTTIDDERNDRRPSFTLERSTSTRRRASNMTPTISVMGETDEIDPTLNNDLLPTNLEVGESLVEYQNLYVMVEYQYKIR
ncbi:hypothetical protein HDU76_013224 [Blyttiomyces sp. JEL0837]|nr:hypothetical protein HDU76_013224 [Blyttiomyces sp. JEL0837]